MKIKLLLLLTIFSINKILGQKNTDSIYEKKMYSLYTKVNKHIYSHQDSANYYFNLMKKLATDNNDFEDLINTLNAHNKSATHFYDFEKVKLNFKQLDSIFLKNKRELQETGNALFYKTSVNFDKGLFYFLLNDYEKSRKAFFSIINTSEKLNKNELNVYYIDLLTSAYSFIAKMYFNDDKHDLAKEYYIKNIHLLELKKTDDVKKINRNYSLLAEVLKSQNQYALSNQYFKKSLKHNLINNGSSSSIVTEANHLLENYLSTSQIDSSKYYLKIIKDNLPENHPRWNIFYEAKAKILEAEDNYPEAEKELQTALELIKLKWKNQPHNDIAEAYNKIGLLHAKFNIPDQALENYDLALQQFSQNNNPSTINHTILLKILKNKAETLNTLTKFSENTATVNQAIQTLDFLKPSFKNNSDKLFLMEEAFPIFESGLEAAYNLHKKTKQDSLINKAFLYNEKSKSALLLEALLSTKATEFANIPKDITEKELLLKSKINHVEKKINNSNDEKLQDELFQLKNNYRELITTIESNYKNYYNLKYNSDVISVKKLQNTLEDDVLLISYFYGTHSIYAIAISKNKKDIIKLPIDDAFTKNLIAFQKDISNPKSDVQKLSKESHVIYSNVLAPLLQNTSAKKLIIITDGLLNYVPFSSLNTSKSNIKYLIEDYAISYANSATLLSQLQEQQKNNSELLAFAPTFSSGNNKLLPLPNNKKEVESILQHVKGNALTGTEASLQNFNEASLDYGIIHLATHAIFDDSNPEYSFLAFAPDTKQENLLYTKDLYNLKLNTDLVTLSACESGIGELKRGEGLMSLARGFYFSGANSIASTLWKINDNSTSQLMDNFYLNLANNDTKNVALQKAQVDFINTNRENALSHPYYWSGFVLSGNTVSLGSTNYWLWIGLGIAFILLLLLFFKLRK